MSSLDWEGRETFLAAEPVPYWVEVVALTGILADPATVQEDGAVMLGGHSTTGGNLTLLVVRDAGGMVPIRWRHNFFSPVLILSWIYIDGGARSI